MRISGKTDQSINGIIRHDEIDAITKEKVSLGVGRYIVDKYLIPITSKNTKYSASP